IRTRCALDAGKCYRLPERCQAHRQSQKIPNCRDRDQQSRSSEISCVPTRILEGSHGLLVARDHCWVGPDIEAERELESGHRLDVNQHVIFGAVARWLDLKLRIASWGKAVVSTHGFDKPWLILC